MSKMAILVYKRLCVYDNKWNIAGFTLKPKVDWAKGNLRMSSLMNSHDKESHSMHEEQKQHAQENQTMSTHANHQDSAVHDSHEMPDNRAAHSGDNKSMDHSAHEEHDAHAGHGTDHTGHEQIFRTRF